MGYRIIRRIGKGGTGTVNLAWHESLKKYVVLKQLTIHPTNDQHLRHEVDVLKNLHHTFLPQVYDCFRMGESFYLVEDYIDGTDLDQALRSGRRFSERQLILWLRQLCQVIAYLHAQRPPIIHSDIKPANIMVTKTGNICLIDFNIAVPGDTGAGILGASRQYASPEQLELMDSVRRGQPLRRRLTPATDIFSIGATFYSMMTLQIPPRQNRVPLALRRDLPYSRELRSLLDRAMEDKPRRRWHSAREMLRSLDHLERLSLQYRRFSRRRLLLNGIGMVLLAAGVLMVQTGLQQRQVEGYRQEYAAVETEYLQWGGTSQELAMKAAEILDGGEYDVILGNRPEEAAQLCAVVGEYYFQQDSSTGYDNAAYYYARALNYLEEGDPEGEYTMNYAAALAMSGQTESARSEAAQLNELQHLYVETELAYYQREYDRVAALAGEAAGRNGDRDTLADIFTTAGRASEQMGDWQGALDWQTAAVREKKNDESVRRLMYLYLNAGGALKRESYYAQAKELYGQLRLSGDEDRLMLALAEYHMGRYQESIRLLRGVDAQSGLMQSQRAFYLAMDYLQIGETEQARNSCREALRQSRHLTEKQREKMDMTGLNRLAEDLNVT